MKRTIGILALLLLSISMVAAAVPTPIAYWSYDQSTWDGTSYADQIGSADAVLYNDSSGDNTIDLAATGIQGEAVEFTRITGNGQYALRFDNLPQINAQSAFTVCTGAYFTNLGADNYHNSLFWLQSSQADIETMYFTIEDGALAGNPYIDFGIGNDSDYNLGIYTDSSFDVTGYLNNDEWTVVCVVNDAVYGNYSDIHFYFNGTVYDETGAGATWYMDPGFVGMQVPVTAGSLTGGTDASSGEAYGTMNSKLDEAYIFNVALSPAQVQELTDNIFSPPVPAENVSVAPPPLNSGGRITVVSNTQPQTTEPATTETAPEPSSQFSVTSTATPGEPTLFDRIWTWLRGLFG